MRGLFKPSRLIDSWERFAARVARPPTLLSLGDWNRLGIRGTENDPL